MLLKSLEKGKLHIFTSKFGNLKDYINVIGEEQKYTTWYTRIIFIVMQ